MSNPNMTIEMVFTFCQMRTVRTSKLTTLAALERKMSLQCLFTLIGFATCLTFKSWNRISICISWVPGNFCKLKYSKLFYIFTLTCTLLVASLFGENLGSTKPCVTNIKYINFVSSNILSDTSLVRLSLRRKLQIRRSREFQFHPWRGIFK